MFRLRQFRVLTYLTLVEAIRQPIFLILTTTCIILSGLAPLLLLHNFGENGKLARDGALAFHFVFGIFVTVYASSTALAREIKSGTASAVLSKPVDRDLFFLAKFAGIALTTVLFSFCCTLATLISEKISEKFISNEFVQGYFTDSSTAAMFLLAPAVAFGIAGIMNYRSKRPFTSTAFIMLMLTLTAVAGISGFFNEGGFFHEYQMRFNLKILPASTLISIALVLLSAMAISFSTRLSAVPTLILVTIFFIAGMMSEYLFMRHPSVIGKILYNIIPDWQNFWLCDALTGGGSIPWMYAAKTFVYAAFYSSAVLCVGMISFRNTEMK